LIDYLLILIHKNELPRWPPGLATTSCPRIQSYIRSPWPRYVLKQWVVVQLPRLDQLVSEFSCIPLLIKILFILVSKEDQIVVHKEVKDQMQEWLELLEALEVNLMEWISLIGEAQICMQPRAWCHLVKRAAEEVKASLMIPLIMGMLPRVSYCTKLKGPKLDRNLPLASLHLKLDHTPVRLSHKLIRDYRKTKFKDSTKMFYQRLWVQKVKWVK
jgi:hypothetical protein